MFFHYKNTKCTLNFGLKSLEKLRSLDCSSQLPATKKTMINFPGANLLLGPFTFLQNESWVFSSTSPVYLYISSVHFKAHRRGDLRNLHAPQFYRAALAFLSVHQQANGRWLTDQSERERYFRYVIKLYESLLEELCFEY